MMADIYAVDAGAIEVMKALGFEFEDDDLALEGYGDVNMDMIHEIVRTFRNVVVTFFEEPVGPRKVHITIEVERVIRDDETNEEE